MISQTQRIRRTNTSNAYNIPFLMFTMLLIFISITINTAIITLHSLIPFLLCPTSSFVITSSLSSKSSLPIILSKNTRNNRQIGDISRSDNECGINNRRLMRSTSTRLHMTFDKSRGLLQILNDEVSDLLLDRLSQKRNMHGRNSVNNKDGSNNYSLNKNSFNTKQPSPPPPPTTATTTATSTKITDGLSKFHQNMLASTTSRQRCVTGKYPLHITIEENPTRKWLLSSSSSSSSSSYSSSRTSSSTSQMLVNGTSISKSLASFDRYQWLDDHEQKMLHQNHTLMSIELLAEIHVRKPGYVNILSAGSAGVYAHMEENNLGLLYYGNDKNRNNNDSSNERSTHLNYYGMTKGRQTTTGIWKNRFKSTFSSHIIENELYNHRQEESMKERMWITGFSLTKQSGELHYVDIEDGRIGSVSKRSASSIRWPNEVNVVPKHIPSMPIISQVDKQLNNNNTSMQSPPKLSHDYEDALLVSDGFLVPGKDNGGLYVVSNPGHEFSEWNACLAGGNGVDRLLNKLEAKKRHNQSLENGKSEESSSANTEEGNSTTTITTTIADDDDGWFYHRSVWVDLTNDGRKSILTARAKRPSILKKTDIGSGMNNSNINGENQNVASMPTKAQLVWLERPQPYRYDNITGTPLDKDGLIFDPFAPKHTPWKVRVLDEGPDVMFSVADLDTSDDTIEVFASQFFNKKVTLHSIQVGLEPKVAFKRVIDDRCGASFSSILANLDTHYSNRTKSSRTVIDCGSTFPTLVKGDGFSHLLVTSHECTFAEEDQENRSSRDVRTKAPNNNLKIDRGIEFVVDNSEPKAATAEAPTAQAIDGGSLFSYRVPEGKNNWKTQPWIRSVIATGFRVQSQLGNMINPGAPGFCYTFYPTREQSMSKENMKLSRPLIAIAGDCAESAYILRPLDNNETTDSSMNENTMQQQDPSSNYAMMCEIECGATVGSIGIGYQDFCFAPQQNGYAKLYIPCYEKDKILVFALGNGEDEEENISIANDGW